MLGEAPSLRRHTAAALLDGGMKEAVTAIARTGLASLLVLAALDTALAQAPAPDILADPSFEAALPPLEETAPPPAAQEPVAPAPDPAFEAELNAPLEPLAAFEERA